MDSKFQALRRGQQDQQNGYWISAVISRKRHQTMKNVSNWRKWSPHKPTKHWIQKSDLEYLGGKRDSFASCFISNEGQITPNIRIYWNPSEERERKELPPGATNCKLLIFESTDPRTIDKSVDAKTQMKSTWSAMTPGGSVLTQTFTTVT